MKKGAIVISTIFLFSGFVFINSADLYTKKQITKFSEELISDNYSVFDYKYHKERWEGEQVIFLADLLYSNIYVHKPEGIARGFRYESSFCLECKSKYGSKFARKCLGHLEYRAGNGTSESYQNGFRKTLANNPELAFKAFELYGENLIRSLKADVRMVHNRKKQLPKHTKDCTGRNHKQSSWNTRSVIGCDYSRPYMANFSPDKFWKQEKELFNQYQRLITYLLTLDDQSLEYFIASVGETSRGHSEQQGAYELKELLIAKGLYKWKGQPNPNLYDYSQYPGDLLRLTCRVNLNYPEWTPRKFLQQALKFSNEVEEVL